MNIATDILVHEHDIILRMINVINNAMQRLNSGEKIETGDLRQMVDFIRNFADHCHHAKEEDVLFKRMNEKGFPVQGGPIQVMLMEHDEGRRYVQNFEKAIDEYEKGNQDAVKQIIENAGGYAMLLTEHIQKENNILYPMGNRIFDENDQKNLIEAFENVEKNIVGEGVHEKYERMVETMEQKYML
ncbi:MAG: hemerythrin [Calditrichaeota bacterium]|nr:hemerythrin [Calditrichota bacterium]